jgi:hypothetical protein
MPISSTTNAKVNEVFGGNAAREVNAILDVLNGPGNNYFVDSVNGSATGLGRSWREALSTLDAAVAKCSANAGDVIHVAPGHAETLSADSAVDIDVAGVTVIGYGLGAARPTFTFDTAATADFKLAAASVTVVNCLFLAGIDALTGPIEISAADCALINCEYRDDGTNNFETTDVVVLTTDAHRCLIDGFKFVSDGGAGGTQLQSVINLTSADECEIRNCFIICDGVLGPIEDATASASLHIHHNYLENTHANDVCITLAATSSGLIHHNLMKIATDAQTSWITGTNDCGLFENYGMNQDSEAGILAGTASV